MNRFREMEHLYQEMALETKERRSFLDRLSKETRATLGRFRQDLERTHQENQARFARVQGMLKDFRDENMACRDARAAFQSGRFFSPTFS
ncbi:MAG: hypothetical protein HYU64_21080 [Armatimonadetes bacterium]|nr:hypothetical protein [Armatimonadota bacterium]